MPKQCPCRAVQNASREHPVWDDRNIRRDRWLINHGGACAVSLGGLSLESTLWAGGQREHQHSNMIPGCFASLTAKLPGATEEEFGVKTRATFRVSRSPPLSQHVQVRFCDVHVLLYKVVGIGPVQEHTFLTDVLAMCSIWQSSHKLVTTVSLWNWQRWARKKKL